MFNSQTLFVRTLLFSLAFKNVHLLLAIHDDEPKVVKRASQERNVLNSVLLTTLTSLMSRLATTLDMEQRILSHEASQNIFFQSSEKYNPVLKSD